MSALAPVIPAITVDMVAQVPFLPVGMNGRLARLPFDNGIIGIGSFPPVGSVQPTQPIEQSSSSKDMPSLRVDMGLFLPPLVSSGDVADRIELHH